MKTFVYFFKNNISCLSVRTKGFVNVVFVFHGGLSLAAEDALDQLIGVDNVAGTMPRVDPGNPDNSYLVLKVEGDPSAGTPMPIGSPGLDAPLAAHIRAWVEAGAPDGAYGVCGEDTGGSDVVEDVVDVVEDPGAPTDEGSDTVSTDEGGGNQNCSSFAETVHPVLEAGGCTTTYCHGGSTAPDLRLENALVSLIGADSMYGNGLKLVVPDSPEGSFLIEKLEGSPPSFGSKMPLGGSIAQSEIDVIRHWISVGAPSIPYDCVEVDAGVGEDTSEPIDEGSDEGSLEEDVTVEPPPSWATDIAPIMTAKCTPCHTGPTCSGGTCFVDSHDDTQTSSNSCVGPMYFCMWMRSESGSMPLGAGCGLDPTGENCLTAEELELLEAWSNAGGPE